MNGHPVETKQNLSVGFGAGGGAGNKAEVDRDALAWPGGKKGASAVPCTGSSSAGKILA